MIDFKDIAESILWGAFRGISVDLIFFPLQNLKTRQQGSLQNEKIISLIKQVFKEEGLAGYYRGLTPYATSHLIKRTWIWPLIIGLPSYLNQFKINAYVSLGLTGVSIAAIESVISTPLMSAKIISITQKQKFSFKQLYEVGWKGFGINITKLAVSWSTFLVSQKYFREKTKQQRGENRLRDFDLIKVSLSSAFFVSLLSAPFDAAYTLNISRNMSFSTLISKKNLPLFFRGYPISFLHLAINNIASIILLEHLERSKNK